MSIGRRLIDMARSELNSLLDAAARHAPDDDDDDRAEGSDRSAHGTSRSAASRGEHLGSSAWQDEAEWKRRAEQEIEDAIHGRKTAEPPPPRGSAGRSGGAGARSASGSSGRGGTGEAARVQKAYATLEVPAGADFETVRKSYRALMRKYHPDHHTQSPEKQRAANERAQRLTDAYKFLEKRLRK